ncbi:MAG: hypothetical protein AUK27_11870 [Deltaproteobacteria bacterium CG2_30_66_27]|nr:MAG: hypothetical protein AUK27_11870 [Deltaproteobacteria bacterium CG2_30_66_27]
MIASVKAMAVLRIDRAAQPRVNRITLVQVQLARHISAFQIRIMVAPEIFYLTKPGRVESLKRFNDLLISNRDLESPVGNRIHGPIIEPSGIVVTGSELIISTKPKFVHIPQLDKMQKPFYICIHVAQGVEEADKIVARGPEYVRVVRRMPPTLPAPSGDAVVISV